MSESEILPQTGLAPDLKGRTCVITGATSGIGRATAVALSDTGANLILVGRRQIQGIQLAARLRRPGMGWVEFCKTDISEQEQVRELAARINAKYPQIDVLINNAGARFNTFQQTSDGTELTFATNYLGHFLLTCLLLESMLRAPQARVITLGSGAHADIDANGPWHLDKANYDRKLAYGKSKLANISFSCQLARRLRSTAVTSNAVDPGGVATRLGRNNGLVSWCRHLAYYALKRQLISARRGAETVVYAAVDPALREVSGRYFHKGREVRPSTVARDVYVGAKLWSLSVTLTRLDRQMGSAWKWIDPETRSPAPSDAPSAS